MLYNAERTVRYEVISQIPLILYGFQLIDWSERSMSRQTLTTLTINTHTFASNVLNETRPTRVKEYVASIDRA